MIIDYWNHIDRYVGLGKHFETAITFLRATNCFELPIGRTEIDGDNVFAIKSQNVLTRPSLRWEAHRRYADIQLMIAGRERFGWAIEAEMKAYQADRDFQSCEPINPQTYDLTCAQFMIFLPGDPHSPGNYIQYGETSEKVIIKVLVEPDLSADR